MLYTSAVNSVDLCTFFRFLMVTAVVASVNVDRSRCDALLWWYQNRAAVLAAAVFAAAVLAKAFGLKDQGCRVIMTVAATTKSSSTSASPSSAAAAA